MKPPYIVQTVDRFFWTGSFWDADSEHAKLFFDRSAAIAEVVRNGTEGTWLIRPAGVVRGRKY